MGTLEDLLLKPLDKMTTEELEEHIVKLKKMRFVEPVVKTTSSTRPKGNKERQLENLLKNITPEQLIELMEKMKGDVDA